MNEEGILVLTAVANQEGTSFEKHMPKLAPYISFAIRQANEYSIPKTSVFLL